MLASWLSCAATDECKAPSIVRAIINAENLCRSGVMHKQQRRIARQAPAEPRGLRRGRAEKEWVRPVQPRGGYEWLVGEANCCGPHEGQRPGGCGPIL